MLTLLLVARRHSGPGESGFQGNLSPDVNALSRLSQDPERFRHYMKYVKYLEFHHGNRCSGNLEPLWEPELWHGAQYRGLTISLHGHMAHDPDISFFLHPQLKVLELYSGFHSDRILQALQVR